MTIADYLASGGIKDALTQTAERAYGSPTPDQQRLAGRLSLHLVHVADDLPPSRATVEIGELRDWATTPKQCSPPRGTTMRPMPMTVARRCPSPAK
jgi:hypothetical protein